MRLKARRSCGGTQSAKRQNAGGRGGATVDGEVVYRLLCPSSRTGSVIGKGGEIIKQLRADTGARIRVEDTVRRSSYSTCSPQTLTAC